MSKYTRMYLALLALVTGLAVNPGIAQQRYDDATVKELQRFNLDIGAFVTSRYNSTIRLDSKSVPIGTVIDLEDSLDVDSSSISGRIDGFYRFNKKHRLDWTYYGVKRKGDAIVTDDINIGDPDDPDGECSIQAGASVQSQWKFQLLKVGYSYSFVNTRKYEMFLGGGLNIRDLDVDIEAQGGISGCEIEDGGGTQVSSGGMIPLPTFNFGGRWNFTSKWQARWQWQFFALEFGDYRGSTRDTTILIEHRTFKNVGFGGGINAFDLQLEAENSDLRGEVTSDYLGVLGYVKVYF